MMALNYEIIFLEGSFNFILFYDLNKINFL